MINIMIIENIVANGEIADDEEKGEGQARG